MNGTPSQPASPAQPRVQRISRIMAAVCVILLAAVVYLVMKPGPPKEIQGGGGIALKSNSSSPELAGFPSSYSDMFARAAEAIEKTPPPPVRPPPPPKMPAFPPPPLAPPPAPFVPAAAPRQAAQARATPAGLKVSGWSVANLASASPARVVNAAAGEGPSASLPASGATGQPQPGEQDNLKGDKYRQGARLEGPRSPYILSAGKLIPVALRQGVQVGTQGAATTSVVAYVRENIWNRRGDAILIPQNTEVLGDVESTAAFGQKRVLVTWGRLLYPNGNTLTLEQFNAHGLEGYAGLAGKVNNHFLKIVGGVLLTTILRVGSRIPAGVISFNEGISPEQQFALDASEGLGDAGDLLLRRIVNLSPTITARAGAAFNIFVLKDLTLEPYVFN